MISRFEFNIQNGERIEIPQVVYRNESGEIAVLDAGSIPPDGYHEFNGEMSDIQEEG